MIQITNKIYRFDRNKYQISYKFNKKNFILNIFSSIALYLCILRLHFHLYNKSI